MKIYRIASGFIYHTNCVGSTAEEINSMQEHPSHIDLTYDEFLNFVSEDELAIVFPYYDWENGDGLKFREDWAASYHKSVYNNIVCAYIVQSAIEWVFVSDEKVPSLSSYKGYVVGSDWIIEGETITNFYQAENGKVFVETNNEYWYDFDKEISYENI